MNQPTLSSLRGAKPTSAGMRTFCVLLIVSLVGLMGCNTPAASEATPTINATMVAGTVSVAQTEAVQSVYTQLTQSAALNPTATALPPTATLPPVQTQTPAPILPTATKVYIPAKITGTPAPTITPTQGPLQCSITKLTPAEGTALVKGVDFDFNVTLKNIGTEKWSADNIDFSYISGAEFHKNDGVIDLPEDVDPDDTVDLVVDMLAKTEPGVQTAVWGLRYSGSTFCTVTLSVTVK